MFEDVLGEWWMGLWVLADGLDAQGRLRIWIWLVL